MNVIKTFLLNYALTIFVLYSIILIVASLWSRPSEHHQTGELALGIAPKEGDNFKMVNVPIVYHLQNGKKRPYKTSSSYFEHNPTVPFGTAYDKGGILICDRALVEQFPMGDYMPLTVGGQGMPYPPETPWKLFQESFFKTDKWGHGIAYTFWAIFFLFFLHQQPQRSPWLAMFWVLLLGTLWGGLIEWAQLELVSGRDKEWLDVLFNSFGLVLGGILFYVGLMPIEKKPKNHNVS